MKHLVAVVGRPNVGKSTLFNKIVGQRLSIEEDTPGVTRDRIYQNTWWRDYEFTLVDTGGLDRGNDIILKQIYNQAKTAIELATVIVFVVDGKTGVVEGDIEVASILRKSKKPIVLVVNKVDNMRNGTAEIFDFYSLGLGDPIPVSASQSLGTGDMLDEIVKHLPKDEKKENEDDYIKVAIVGKPNVGKSSLINRILGHDRLIVSDIPGTTRDAIDTYFTSEDKKYIFIDTAGIRKKNKIKENIEKYSILRAVAAVERCDVCILIISAEEGITDQDAKIIGLAHESGKACIIAVNKWDAIEKDNNTMKDFTKQIESRLSYMSYAPKIFISALTGQRINTVFEHINTVYDNATKRVSTGLLNDVIIEAVAHNPTPYEKGRHLKIYYTTQVKTKPPTFVLFVNDPVLLHFSYRRYIENQLRSAFGFSGTPIHFLVRQKNS
ncbi:MAG: ribosome biogenesis GTPase Der [Defluviitaleaceae bacterium]|nr:ribosome biogenesis GTPase Der [Defluviitaleaceae bacterium]